MSLVKSGVFLECEIFKMIELCRILHSKNIPDFSNLVIAFIIIYMDIDCDLYYLSFQNPQTLQLWIDKFMIYEHYD